MDVCNSSNSNVGIDCEAVVVSFVHAQITSSN